MESMMLFILITFFPIIIILLRMLSFNEKPSKLRSPPGPWKLPIIGNLHQLVGELPHRRLHRLAGVYGPLMQLKMGEINLVVITSAELVRAVFKTYDLQFASRPRLFVSDIIFYNAADLGFAQYGKQWLHLRRICTTELFCSKRVKSFSSIRMDEVNKFVENIRDRSSHTVNLSEIFLSVINNIIARATLGKGCKHQERILLGMKKVMQCVSGFNIVDAFPSWGRFLGEVSGMRRRIHRVHKEMDAIMREIIEEHMAKDADENEDNIVNVLLRLKRNGGIDDFSLTIENIKAVILEIFFAGTESTSTTLDWAMTELIRHPKIMQKAQLEVRTAFNGRTRIEEEDINKLSYLKNVIIETLRIHPIAPLLVPRLCHDEVELNGITLQANSRVVINAWSIMRDPKYWDDPECFRPERFDEISLKERQDNFEFIPFGGGRRICPGMSFAFASMECCLAQMLCYFNWELPEGKIPYELDIDEAFGITRRRKNNLHLVARLHQ